MPGSIEVQAMRTEFGVRGPATIEDQDSDLHLGRPAFVGVRAQSVADHPLEARMRSTAQTVAALGSRRPSSQTNSLARRLSFMTSAWQTNQPGGLRDGREIPQNAQHWYRRLGRCS